MVTYRPSAFERMPALNEPWLTPREPGHGTVTPPGPQLMPSRTVAFGKAVRIWLHVHGVAWPQPPAPLLIHHLAEPPAYASQFCQTPVSTAALPWSWYGS